MQPIIRAYDAVVDDVNKADRTLVAKINTAGVDRYRTVIDPRGARLENYRKNPAVLWEHGKDPRRHTDPIGRNVWIKHNGGHRPDTLLARTKFLDDDFSRQRFEWYRDGVLNAFSVNILPDDYGPPTQDELRAMPTWEGAGTVYRTWDLAEYSGTTIPGNADCLAERAGPMADLVNRGLLWLPEEIIPLIERYITHEGDKWIVHAESGKVLGEHDSKEDAENQLAAVEAHKHGGGRALPEIHGTPLVEIARILADERRSMKQALRDEILATIDLVFYGRV